MLSCENSKLNIDIAKPHTIQKIELVSNYVEKWAYKILNFNKSKGIIYIDCMSNSGKYYDKQGKEVDGTPVIVANKISEIMLKYNDKNAVIYFNDISSEKIDLLKQNIPQNSKNFEVKISNYDANELLKSLSNKIPSTQDMSYLLFYDPYEASIDWEAITPFLNKWGEVIINHMVFDTKRGVSQAKRKETINKYENTYQKNIDSLIDEAKDKESFETRIQEIIQSITSDNKKGFIASFPFFNTRNALVYNLIHCTKHIEGFKLFKKVAWKTFGDRSSSKKQVLQGKQLKLDVNGSGDVIKPIDNYCYSLDDVASYLQNKFVGQNYVAIKKVWEILEVHPVYPTDGYKKDIKKILKETYNDEISIQHINFSNKRGL